MNCPGCLKEMQTDGYCRKCLSVLFEGKRVPAVLTISSPQLENAEFYQERTKKLSISGVQVKYSLRLEGKVLVLTDAGGQYILKPIPVGQFKYLDEAPANEHLTMQLAGQLFGLDTPPNAIIHFADGAPAYLVKRFDLKADGAKLQQEDFAQIAETTEETHGRNYKYDLSYEEIGALIRRYIPSYPIELEKFFRLVLFNYAFSNGDAHLKNFSAIQTAEGDYVLTPAYDLLCTRIHSPSEPDMALTLFKDRFTEAYHAHGFYTRPDFLEFGHALGMKEHRVLKIMQDFQGREGEIDALINASYLNTELKKYYKEAFRDKLRRLSLK